MEVDSLCGLAWPCASWSFHPQLVTYFLDARAGDIEMPGDIGFAESLIEQMRHLIGGDLGLRRFHLAISALTTLCDLA